MDLQCVMEDIMSIIEDVADIPRDEMKTDSAIMDDLELSSLEVIIMISEVEKQYKTKIPEKELYHLITIEDLANYLMNEAAMKR